MQYGGALVQVVIIDGMTDGAHGHTEVVHISRMTELARISGMTELAIAACTCN